MKSSKLFTVLIELGLSENEARVYLAALALGGANITDIAKSATIKRTTAYHVIEGLQQKGLVNLELRGLKNLFVAEDPEKLKAVLEAKREALNKALPEFSALFNLRGSESLVKYYEGLEASKTVYEGLLRDIGPHEDYMVVANLEIWYQLDPVYFQSFIERRAKLPIKIRMILEDTPKAREIQKYQQNYNETVKLLPKGVTFKINLITTPQKVVLHQLVPPIKAIVLENSFFVDMQQQVFNLLWDTLP